MTELLLDKFRVLYRPDEIPPSSLVPYVLEAAWETASWQTLHELLPRVMSTNETEFSTGLAKVMNAMFERDNEHVSHLLIECSKTLLEDLSHSSIQSLQGAHQLLLRLHVLEEVQIISRTPYAALDARSLIDLRTDLGRRLAMLGSSNRDKQYVLSIRRAVMALSGWVAIIRCSCGILD